MITVNMHEAKSRLSQLVKAVEERGETVFICRNGKLAASLVAARPKSHSRLEGDPALKVAFAPGYDPAEPLRDDEIPAGFR
ncbi:MAG: type II toxin-antitoxin system Phd/YefM family antitoxin [Verrucomicrobiae bacterium]|nr:type II toxin-antitoxin system Phd/YefM family antitoxin [Verrucomicrobiae bacterium]